MVVFGQLFCHSYSESWLCVVNFEMPASSTFVCTVVMTISSFILFEDEKTSNGDNPVNRGLVNDFKIYRCGECDAYFVNVSTLLAHMELHIVPLEDSRPQQQQPQTDGDLHDAGSLETLLIKQEGCQISDVEQVFCIIQDKDNSQTIEGHSVEVVRFSTIQKLSGERFIKVGSGSTNAEVDSTKTLKKRGPGKQKTVKLEPAVSTEEVILNGQTVQVIPKEDIFVANEDEPPYRCGICGKQLASSRSRDRHVGLHAGEKPHACGMCDKKFANPYDLKKHCRVHTGEKPYECDICKRCFAQSSTMTIHRQTHDRRTPSLCSICGNQFSSIKSLRLHIKLHSEETSFECVWCGKRFGQIGRLKRHIRNHTGERPYVCETCGKSFLTPRTFQAHNSTHTGERPHACPFCPKSFADAGILRKHKRIHTGERPYKCETCSKDFGQAESLRIHRRTHTGERPYKCTDCDKSFQSISNLKTHSRTHTKEKPYSCVQCGVTYSTNGQLVKHTQKVHNLSNDRPSQTQAMCYSTLLEEKSLCGWS